MTAERFGREFSGNGREMRAGLPEIFSEGQAYAHEDRIAVPIATDPPSGA